MAETKYYWPSKEDAQVIGTKVKRQDAIEKATGRAKYTYDVNLKNQLIAKSFDCPLAHCNVKSIDTSKAEKTPGVVHVMVLNGPGTEIKWLGELIAVVAAESEAAAAEGVKNLKVELEPLEVFVEEDNLEAAEKAERTRSAGGRAVTQNEPGDDDDEDEFVEQELDRLFKQAKYVVEGQYGVDAITHCCLEPHGSTVEWKDGKLKAYLSTQNVSGTDDGFARDLGVTADDVSVTCDYIGGGFGSKFAPDYWGVAAAKISKETGRPVKLMLDRDQELKIAGNRPSGYINVRLGADEKGRVIVWDSHHWGSSGESGGGVSQSVVPYVLEPPNYRRKATGIRINAVQARAWRAPNHPQACALTQTALDDLARAMGKDSYEVFQANLENASNDKAEVYAEEMKIAADLIGWKEKYHLHGKGSARGSIVDGLGMALHTWGGVANSSNCLLKIYPDGSVQSYCGTQDIGTGTRTICQMVLAETFGLEVDDIDANIGSSDYPISGASGGSTTVGAVTESHRRAGLDAQAKLFEQVAKKLNVAADQLEARGGRVQVKGNDEQGMSWKEACSLLGMSPLEVTASHSRGAESPLSSSGVGGVQMAHVEVDKDTGVIRMKKFVAVQDQGLVINPQTCESQIYGAVIMGIAAALFEHRVLDPKTGAFVNAELSDYKLARLGDIGEIVVHLYQPESERSRGVIGNGEPPAISPMAAISNAVCNALGVRVPVVPMTPKRVLDALNRGA